MLNYFHFPLLKIKFFIHNSRKNEPQDDTFQDECFKFLTPSKTLTQYLIINIQYMITQNKDWLYLSYSKQQQLRYIQIFLFRPY
ncbi:hypothetical protein pb186bvf_002720 [Paramecium bursaria]